SGSDCLGRLPRCAPDLVLLDVSMPGIDGWEVVRRIRARDPLVPRIVVVSANALENQHPRDEACRTCDFLVKPVVISHLLDLVRKNLGLAWTVTAERTALPVPPALPAADFPAAHIDELITLGNVGYVRGIEAKLDSIARATPEAA